MLVTVRKGFYLLFTLLLLLLLLSSVIITRVGTNFCLLFSNLPSCSSSLSLSSSSSLHFFFLPSFCFFFTNIFFFVCFLLGFYLHFFINTYYSRFFKCTLNIVLEKCTWYLTEQHWGIVRTIQIMRYYTYLNVKYMYVNNVASNLYIQKMHIY